MNIERTQQDRERFDSDMKRIAAKSKQTSATSAIGHPMNKRTESKRYAEACLGTVQRGVFMTNRTRLKGLLESAFLAGWEAAKVSGQQTDLEKLALIKPEGREG